MYVATDKASNRYTIYMWVVSTCRASLGFEILSRRIPTISGSIEIRNEQTSRVMIEMMKKRHSLDAYFRSFL
jgi:hypothetical protein